MRFVIGLLSGAALILLLAQSGGNAGRPWLERLPEWFDGVAAAVGDALALPPRPPARVEAPAAVRESAAVKRSAAVKESAAAIENAAKHDAAAMGDDAALVAEPASLPIPRPPDPRPMDVDEAAAPDPTAATEDVARIVAEVFGAPGAQRPASAAAIESSQPVWVPFHSQMSASGFAERLSDSLDHPFRVERRGPGRYQVVFPYRDEPQRLALLAQAAELTGLSL